MYMVVGGMPDIGLLRHIYLVLSDITTSVSYM